MTNRKLAPILALLTLGACSAEPSAPVTHTSPALAEAEARAAAVSVLDSGTYPGRYIYHGAAYDSFWVDLSVRSDASTKEVGIVWTSDRWATQTTTMARYEGAQGGGRERWGLDVVDAVAQAGWQPRREIEYAAFVRMNGQTAWSPFRNHYIYEGVTPARPLRLLAATAALEGGRPVVRGRVRALNVGVPRRVFVRYSMDAWRSFAEVEAAIDGGDLAFAIAFAGDAARTETVDFALRLEAGGEVAWDNADGRDHHVRLAPALIEARATNRPAYPAAGIANLSGRVETALPVDALRLRIAGGPVIELPVRTSDAGGFTADGGFQLPLPTAGLAAGEHATEIEAQAGPFVRRFAGPSLLVDDRIAALEEQAVGEGESPWDFQRLGEDRLIVRTDSRVVVYERGVPRLLEQPPVGLGVGDVAADGAGHILAIGGSSLLRWREDGALDRGFGDGGRLELARQWAGVALCWPSHLSADASSVLVVDSCNARVLRFDHAGALLEALPLGAGVWHQVEGTFRAGERVWVARIAYFDEQNQAELVELAVRPGAPLEVVGTRRLPPGYLSAFAVDAGGAWVASGDDVHRVDLDGSRIATYTGGGGLPGAPRGGLGIVRRLALVPGGGVEALSVQSARIVRLGM